MSSKDVEKPLLENAEDFEGNERDAILNEVDEEAVKKGSSVMSASFTLANAAIGSGVLSFPYAYQSAGVGLSLAFTLIVAVLLYYTIFLLVRAAREHKSAFNFEETVEVILGPIASHFLKGIIVFAVVGATTGYLVLIGDNATSMLRTWLGDHWYTERWFVILVPATTVALPLSLLSRIEYLSFSSAASIMAVCYIVCVVIAESVVQNAWTAPDMVLKTSRGWINPAPELFLCVPICCYALGCHTQAIAIYGSLKEKDKDRMGTVMCNTFAMALCLYIPMGITGYVLFGAGTPHDVLDGFGTDLNHVPLHAQLGRIAIAIVGLTAFPIQMWPARSILRSYVFAKAAGAPWWWMPFQVSVLWALVVGLALSGINISTVFGIVGSTAAVGIVFVFPVLMGLRTTLRESRWHHYAMVTVMIVGGLIGLIGTGTTIYEAVKPTKD